MFSFTNHDLLIFPRMVERWVILGTRIVDICLLVLLRLYAWTSFPSQSVRTLSIELNRFPTYTITACAHTHTHAYSTLQPLTSIADLKIPPESQQAGSSHIRAADIMPAASATTLCNRYTAYIKTCSINNPVHTADLLKSNSCFHQSVISMLSRKACIKH